VEKSEETAEKIVAIDENLSESRKWSKHEKGTSSKKVVPLPFLYL